MTRIGFAERLQDGLVQLGGSIEQLEQELEARVLPSLPRALARLGK